MPKGLRNLPITFEEPHLTHFAGMALIHAFCNRLGLKRLLQQALRPSPRYRDYHPTEMLVALLYAIIAGMERVNETQILQYNGAFQKIVGLSRFPDQTAIRRFLKRLTPKQIRQIVGVHDLLRQRLFDRPNQRTSLIFDLDSRVLVVYGRWVEGARVGYNPKKHGRRSYHPLLAFESRFQEFWHGSLRPGEAAQTHPQVAHPLPVGFRVLWEARGRIPRRWKLWICDRRQSQKARSHHYQSQELQVHSAPKWLGGRSVLVPTSQVGEATSLCGGAPAHPRGRGGGRATD